MAEDRPDIASLQASPSPAVTADAPLRPRRSPAALVALLAALFVVGTLAGVWVQTHGGLVHVVETIPGLPTYDLREVFGKQNLRIAVMGLDENWTTSDVYYTTGARTDTLLAVNINLGTRDVGIISVPRDLWVAIPKSGHGKINEAYADGGPLRTIATMQQSLGMPAFDYYVVLRIDATKNIVNALGGVDVNVEKDMDYDDNWGQLHIHLKKGMHHLNGEQVVGYVRFRHDEEGDFGRMRRQRQVIQVLVHKLKDPAVALQVQSLVNTMRDNVRTNMPYDKMFALAVGLKDVSPRQVHTEQLPAEIGYTAGQSVLFPIAAADKAVVRKYMIIGFGGQFDPSTVHVRVENGSGRPGAASTLADYLRLRGFNVISTGNAKTFDRKRTSITGPDYKVIGEVVKVLPMHDPQVAVGPVDDGDIDIIVGQDFRAQ